MTAEKEYLLYLISCFLGGNEPKGREVNLKELYRLAKINDVCAVLAYESKLISDDFPSDDEIESVLNQHLGMALKAYEEKKLVLEKLKGILNSLELEYLFVKGAVIKELYPVKQFRTSGDFDVIIRDNAFQPLVERLKSKALQSELKITDFDFTHYAVYFRINGCLIELHRDADLKNDYFGDIFEVAKKVGKYEYQLGLYDHLIYCFLHLVKHLKHRGAGIRMLMDLDVIIRSIENFDENKFYSMAEKAGKLNTARVVLSYCSYYLKTPVRDIADIEHNPELCEKLSVALIDGGSFGYEKENLGIYHYNRTNGGKAVNSASRLKTVLGYIFPSTDYIREYREYSMRHSFLIPLAYAARIKDGLFKRKELSLKTLKQISNITEEDLKNKKLLEELDFDKQED